MRVIYDTNDMVRFGDYLLSDARKKRVEAFMEVNGSSDRSGEFLKTTHLSDIREYQRTEAVKNLIDGE